MTNGVNDAVMRELEAIRREYEAQLAGRIAEIVTAWEAAKEARDRYAAARDVEQLAHSVAGTSGVLGLAQVSRAAATVENALDLVQQGGTPSAVDTALHELISAGPK